MHVLGVDVTSVYRFRGAKDMDDAMSLGRFVEILPLDEVYRGGGVGYVMESRVIEGRHTALHSVDLECD